MKLATTWTGAKRARLGIALLATALGTAGCGGKDTVTTARIRGTRLTIYASVPLNGASSVSGEAAIAGARLALTEAKNHVGMYGITLRVLDDATPTAHGWDPGQTTTDAKLAVLDPTTIGYLGELNSGASAVSIPVLNHAGIPQISPTSSAVGLTSSAPGSFPGEPQKYYPTGVRTFARVVPNDSIQALAQVRVQQSMGCRKVYVLDDGEVDGAAAARSFEVAAVSAGIRLVGTQSFVRGAGNYRGVVASIAQTAPECVLISADTESGAALLTTEIAAAMPAVKIFGTAGLAESTYTDPEEGGIPLAVDPRVVLTAPTLGLNDDPASARAFTAAYQRRFGPPEPDAILGYEAMSLFLSAIERATDHGTAPAQRTKVLAAIFSTHDRHSVLGTYSLDRNGDTTLRRYGVYGIVGGQLTFWKAIDT